MTRIFYAALAGLLFGAGLAGSGMIDPMRVRGFLDLFGGAWDPTLAFVMGGAMVPMAIAWRLRLRLAKPLAADRFNVPETVAITPRLLIGALLFGIGWGVAGLCPGPAIADFAIEPVPAAIFVAAMVLGFGLHRLVDRKMLSPAPAGR